MNHYLPLRSNCLQSSKLKALKGRTILARGKRESASAPPRVLSQKLWPLTAKPREIASGAATANLICGIPFALALNETSPHEI